MHKILSVRKYLKKIIEKKKEDDTMKVFRDMCIAISIGIIGGLLVTTISYYNKHKDGGLGQTLMAVADSFHTVSSAYSDKETESLFDQLEQYDMNEYVLQTFEQMEGMDYGAISKSLLEDLRKAEIPGSEADILAMDGTDGNIEEGAPYAGILRFHVRANSDSTEDQELKMAVKEDVVTMLKPYLTDCNSVAESKRVILSKLNDIYETAINTITEQGYDYDVRVYVTQEEFPAKTYGDITFPQGKYQALRIDIGFAQGQNWWCVMYPPLCFIDDSTAVVSEDGKALLRENLTQEEYDALFTNPETPIKMESYLWNLFHKEGNED